MIRIAYEQAILIEEHRGCLFEGDTVFLDIAEVLCGIPFESDIHTLHCRANLGRRKTAQQKQLTGPTGERMMIGDEKSRTRDI